MSAAGHGEPLTLLEPRPTQPGDKAWYREGTWDAETETPKWEKSTRVELVRTIPLEDFYKSGAVGPEAALRGVPLTGGEFVVHLFAQMRFEKLVVRPVDA